MIVKMDFQDIGIVGIKTTYNNKTKNHYIRYIVDEYSLERAIEAIKGNKWVISLDYEGDLAHLFMIEELPTVPLIVTKEFQEITELSLDFFMMQVPKWVRVAIKTPKDFSDMKMIADLSKKYPNIRFCQGKFLRLPCCNIGCIDKDDLPTKVADSKISYYTEGCSCIVETMKLDELEGEEILYKDIEDKREKEVKDIREQVVQEVKGKRVFANLEDLLK